MNTDPSPNRFFAGTIIMAFLCFVAEGLFSQQLEEFNGPLPGWANVKTRFKAKADGITDDTRAIQQALDSLSQPLAHFNMEKKAYAVIYLPAGTYNISATLLLKGKIGVSLIGESPASVSIRWIGADSDTMFTANGSAYFKVSRITWNANGRKNMEALGIHWKDQDNNERSRSSAPTNIEISDNVFTGNCKFGISGGTVQGEGTGAMDAEVSIRRCVFDNCETGIQVKGYNALDYWIWDCKFIKCSFGVKCNSGNYHVYRSYFSNCYSDVENTNSYYISLRGCYSENATHFCYDQGASSNPFKRIFQGNTVIAPKEIPIISYHLGKITLLDNQFDSSSGKSVSSFVETGGLEGGHSQVLSINNNYRNSKVVKFTRPASTLFSYGDKNDISVQKNETPFTSAQEKMPITVTRALFAVPAGSGSAAIQDLINQAMQSKDRKALIYFPQGRFMLDQPLAIPAGADLQMTGEGFLHATMLIPSANFPKGKALINVKGPTKVVIRDLQLGDFTNTMNGTDGIQCSNVDQPGSQAFVEQLYTNSHHAVAADGLDYLYVQESNSFFSDGNTITGGPLVQQGKGTAALYCFGAQFAGLAVDKNAVAVVKDCWWEGAMRQPLDFTGTGRITIDGAMVASNKADSTPTLVIHRFAGKISLLNMYFQGGISVQENNPQLSLLLWNIHFYFALDPLKFLTAQTNYRVAAAGLNTQCFIPGDKKCDYIFTVNDTSRGNVKMDDYFPEMLADDRKAMPRKFLAAPSGASSILVSRVSAGDCNTSIRFTK